MRNYLIDRKIPLIITSIILLFIGVISYHIYINQPARITYPELADDNTCLALNYHRIRTADPINKFLKFSSSNNELRKYNVFEDDFKRQMKWLKRHDTHFVNQQQFNHYYDQGKFPKRCVWISFDDADRTTYTNAMPILKKMNIPATVFIIAGQAGNDFNNIELADWDELRKMKDSGVFDFGSHTYNMHELVEGQPIYTNAAPVEFKADLLHSKRKIKEELGVVVTSFAYPYGDASDEVAATIKSAGFKHAYILSPKAVLPNHGPLRINRIMVDDDVFERHIKKWKQFK